MVLLAQVGSLGVVPSTRLLAIVEALLQRLRSWRSRTQIFFDLRPTSAPRCCLASKIPALSLGVEPYKGQHPENANGTAAKQLRLRHFVYHSRDVTVRCRYFRWQNWGDVDGEAFPLREEPRPAKRHSRLPTSVSSVNSACRVHEFWYERPVMLGRQCYRLSNVACSTLNAHLTDVLLLSLRTQRPRSPCPRSARSLNRVWIGSGLCSGQFMHSSCTPCE